MYTHLQTLQLGINVVQGQIGRQSTETAKIMNKEKIYNRLTHYYHHAFCIKRQPDAFLMKAVLY